MQRTATFDDLIGKKPRTVTKKISTVDENGESVQLVVTLQAMPPAEYDKLLSDHPPTATQKANGEVFNADTFPPALIAASMIEPALTIEQATDLWNSPRWSRGELADIFSSAAGVNNEGFSVTFT